MTDAELQKQVDSIWDQFNELSAKVSRLTDGQRDEVFQLRRDLENLQCDIERRLDDQERRISDLESRQARY